MNSTNAQGRATNPGADAARFARKAAGRRFYSVLPTVLALGLALFVWPQRVDAQQSQAQTQALLQLVTQAEQLAKQGRLPEALKKGEEAIRAAGAALGENHEVMGTLQHVVGDYAQRAGDLKAARRHLERSLQIRRLVKGETHADTTLTRLSLGLLCLDEGKFKEALPLIDYALKSFRSTLGENHLNTALAWEALGRAQYRLANFRAAKQSWEQALAIAMRTVGLNNEATAYVLTELGAVDQDLGDFATARKHLEQALAVQRKVLGPAHQDVAVTLSSLGQLAWNTGDFKLQRQYFDDALRIMVGAVGEQHLSVALLRIQFGRILSIMGDFTAAEAEFTRAFAVLVTPQYADKPQLGDGLIWFGEHLGLRKQYKLAIDMYQRGLDLLRKVYGENQPALAAGYTGMGMALLGLGRRPEAREALSKALAIRRKAFGDNSFENAYPMYYLADCDYREGHFEKAEKGFAEAQRVFRLSQTADHPLMLFTNFNRVACRAALEQWGPAADLADETRRGMRRQFIRILPSLTEREQLAFMARFDDISYAASLTLGWRRMDDPRTVERSCEWLLNNKAAGQEALAQQAMLSRDVNDARLGPAIRLLTEVRQTLARVSLAALTPGAEPERERLLRQLADQEATLSRQCSRQAVSRPADEMWVTANQVRSVLPANAVLIEIARLRPVRFGAPSEAEDRLPPRYVAWIIPPKDAGSVSLVDLGEAEPIDELVGTVRKKIAEAASPDGKLRQEGEPAAWDELLEPLTALADNVWKPLAEKIGNARTVVLSPDGALWLAPWAALPLSKDEVLIERHAVQLVVSGRTLIESHKMPGKASGPVIFANPEFESTPDQVQAAVKAVFRNESIARGDSVAVTSQLPSVAALPGTAAEAQAILKNLESYAHAAPSLYEGRYALETVAKRLHRPKVAVLSTHGFFLASNPEGSTVEASLRGTLVTGFTGIDKAENPLAKCGLLLAGCNPRNSGQSGGADDGVLTGVEILNMDLRGTELVVLSACETGIGKVNNGEGVAGLRQAFQLAGADCVVSTLWQIPDADSAILMNDFFANLAAGQTKAEALRGAQLKRIQARRDRNGAAHPFYWAAWTVTGR